MLECKVVLNDATLSAYEAVVVRSKLLSLHAQSMPWQATFASGAKQLVVHEAFDTTSMLLLSYFFSFTPITNMGASFEGAEMMTCSSNSIEHGYAMQSCSLCKSRANSRSRCIVKSSSTRQAPEYGADLLGSALKMARSLLNLSKHS